MAYVDNIEEVEARPLHEIDLTRTLHQDRAHYERMYCEEQLLRCGGHVTNAARAAGMERSAFHRKLRELGLK
ncbi:MAG: helix-turn-helix domain-containing protein [Phycisphaerales bacterium]